MQRPYHLDKVAVPRNLIQLMGEIKYRLIETKAIRCAFKNYTYFIGIRFFRDFRRQILFPKAFRFPHKLPGTVFTHKTVNLASIAYRVFGLSSFKTVVPAENCHCIKERFRDRK